MLAAVILVTVREPERNVEDASGVENMAPVDLDWRRKVAIICRTFVQPSLLVLCLAGSIRNAGQNASYWLIIKPTLSIAARNLHLVGFKIEGSLNDVGLGTKVKGVKVHIFVPS